MAWEKPSALGTVPDAEGVGQWGWMEEPEADGSIIGWHPSTVTSGHTQPSL